MRGGLLHLFIYSEEFLDIWKIECNFDGLIIWLDLVKITVVYFYKFIFGK